MAFVILYLTEGDTPNAAEGELLALLKRTGNTFTTIGPDDACRNNTYYPDYTMSVDGQFGVPPHMLHLYARADLAPLPATKLRA